MENKFQGVAKWKEGCKRYPKDIPHEMLNIFLGLHKGETENICGEGKREKV